QVGAMSAQRGPARRRTRNPSLSAGARRTEGVSSQRVAGTGPRWQEGIAKRRAIQRRNVCGGTRTAGLWPGNGGAVDGNRDDLLLADPPAPAYSAGLIV